MDQLFEPDPGCSGGGNELFGKFALSLAPETQARKKVLEKHLQQALSAIETLRREGASVHCITNTVAQTLTANILLACGATPSMTVSPEEAGHFTQNADALLINLGTLSESRKKACMISAKIAAENNVPFVLDPVMCHRSPPRADFARQLIQLAPSIIRFNRAEAELLLAEGGMITEKLCLAITGDTDRIVHDGKDVLVTNGHFFMSGTIAIGCAQGAVMAALAARAETHFAATLASLLWFGVAGELAAAKCSGLGDFPSQFVTELHEVPLSRIGDMAAFS